IELLPRFGFTYSSNLMDDVRPYRHDRSDVIELPVHWVLDDAPHFWFDAGSWTKTIRTAAEVEALWEEEVAGIRALGGLAVVTMHPQVIGRPGRLAMLDRFLGWVRRLGDAWIAPCAEIAAHAREADR
ncbi:MAG TPA: ribulose phosphate epimerase, partial [Actinomycetota bacterium]|nr:ribulose phosphate epimerase [Actinomycetota bacterium]